MSADALSCAPISSPNKSDKQFTEVVEAFDTTWIDQLPANAQHLQKIVEA